MDAFKGWKTVILNVLTFLVFITQTLTGYVVVANDLLVQANIGLNLVMRWFTEDKMGLKKKLKGS